MIDVVSAAIVHRPSNRLLLVQRKPEGSHPWKWVTPGGKVEPLEASAPFGEVLALTREIGEECGKDAPIWLSPGETWRIVYIHDVPSTRTGHIVRVTCYAIEVERVDCFVAQPSEGIVGLGWWRADQIAGLDLGPADAANMVQLASAVRGALGRREPESAGTSALRAALDEEP